MKNPTSITERQRGAIIPVVLILLLIALMVRLGFWQLKRAEEKDALLQAFAQGRDRVEKILGSGSLNELPRYQMVQLRGRLLSRPVILLENRFLGDRPGLDVLLLFQPESGPLVLLNQGWVPKPPEKGPLPGENLTVTARVDEYPRPGVVLGEPFAGVPPEARYWATPYVDQRSLEARLGRAVAGRILLMEAPLIPGAKPHWQPATMPPEKHRGYALQWFSMAAALGLIGLWLLRKKARK